MTPEEKVAYINSQITCAQIEMNAMLTTNEIDKHNNNEVTYKEADFRYLLTQYHITHNDVIGYFQ